MSLLIKKQEKFLQLCAASLPEKAQSEDANKLALIYFVLHGLDLLGKLPDEFSQYSELVYQHLIPLADTSMQGFRPSQTFALPESNAHYDLPSLSATLFALTILLVLKNDFSTRLDRHKIMKFVAKCQIASGQDKGSFRPILGSDNLAFGESDLRLCYIAASIRKILGYDKLDKSQRLHDIDVESLTEFILNKFNFNGGLASSSHTESHSGLTFCGLAALRLLGYDMSSNQSLVDLTTDWLVHRQVAYPDVLYKETDYEYYDEVDVGGFNGRENKFGDTCYSWWVLGLLEMLDSENGVLLVNMDRAADYLLLGTQHSLMGGFGKNTDAFPDPFHTYMGLCSLALMKEKGLAFEGSDDLRAIDPELVITRQLREFMDKMWPST